MTEEEQELGAGDFAGLLQFLHETPPKLSQLIDGLLDSGLRSRTSDDQFSVLENLCHLRDIEAEGYATRILRILGETNPFLADIDGTRMAIERQYNNQNANSALSAFAEARSGNLRQLQGVTEEQLEREGTLEGVGRLTLRRLIEMMREHDEGHIEEVRVLRRQLKTATRN